jgi:hypothetical protein
LHKADDLIAATNKKVVHTPAATPALPQKEKICPTIKEKVCPKCLE